MIEIEGLTELVVDLTRAPFEARVKTRGVVQASAGRVKADAQMFAAGLSHAPSYPRSITYETTEKGVGEVDGEIGPDKNKPQGALGNLLEYGSANNAPHAHLGPALDREGPKFERAIAEIVDGIL